MMISRPTTPEHLRLSVAGGAKHAYLTQAHLEVSTTAALQSMHRSVREKGHALQVVDSTSPGWDPLAATTQVAANKMWKVTLRRFDTSLWGSTILDLCIDTSQCTRPCL